MAVSLTVTVSLAVALSLAVAFSLPLAVAVSLPFYLADMKIEFYEIQITKTLMGFV